MNHARILLPTRNSSTSERSPCGIEVVSKEMRRVCLWDTRCVFLHFSRHHFDPATSINRLAPSLRLTALLCLVALLRSITSWPAASLGFPPLVSFAPCGPCPALGSFLKQLLVIFFGRNTVPAVLLTRTFLPHFACTVYWFLLTPRPVPC